MASSHSGRSTTRSTRSTRNNTTAGNNSRRPEGLPRSPGGIRSPPPAVVPAASDESVVSYSSTGTRRPGLPPHYLTQALQDIESQEFGGIAAIQNQGPGEQLLCNLLDKNTEFYGEKGDNNRILLGKYVDRWKNYSREKYLEKVLPRYQVSPVIITKKTTAKGSAKKRKKAAVASRDQGEISDLEIELEDTAKDPSFVITEVVTSSKTTSKPTTTMSASQASVNSQAPGGVLKSSAYVALLLLLRSLLFASSQ